MIRVYVETTIPSYLTAHLSRDLQMAARQQASQDWWDVAPKHCELFISELVWDEISGGDAEAAVRRQHSARDLPRLVFVPEMIPLIEAYENELGLPEKARPDIVHVAFAVAYEIDYLVTWNCRDIANPETIERLFEINLRLSAFNPRITTPDVMLELWAEE